MKRSSEVEIPLLQGSQQYAQGADYDKKRKDHQSHFLNFFSSSSPPSKYLQKVPFLKWLTFFDVVPWVQKVNSSSTSLSASDIPLPNKSFNVEAKIIDLDYYWSQEMKKTEPSFYRALCYTFKREIIIAMALNFVDCTARICYSLFMGRIIDIISSSNFGEQLERDELLESSILLCLLIVLSYFAVNWSFFQLFSNGGKARLTITGLLYKKLNSISLTSLHDFKIGKVINLMANDLNDIDSGIIFVPTMFLCPYLLALSTFIMWGYFGLSCIIGLVSSVIFLVCQVILSNKTVGPRKENKQLTDDRVKYTNEIIENIRLIKMYAWEKPFRENVENLRDKEYGTFQHIVKIDAIGRNFSIISVYLSILLICMAYTSSGGVLTPEKVYATMMILSFLSVTGLMFFHLGRMFFVNFKVILKRVEQIMTIEDILTTSETLQVPNQHILNSQETKVVFENFTAYWSKDAQQPCLSNLNLTFNPKQITTVIGKIGSGKTTLLLSLLKELPVIRGYLNIRGKVAYVEQEPIIFSGTVRENILFGKQYNDSLYKQVIKICTLDVDLELLSHGDMTLIGEKGVNLSGGQKARLSLARAIYSESDIYLLDDPFAAVDSKVAREIFEKGLKGDLLKEKTVILVTHHIHFARESDYVVVMNDGQVEAQGTFSEIEKMNVDLLNIFNLGDSRKSSVYSQPDSIKGEEEREEKDLKNIVREEGEKQTEETATSVSWSTYKNYMQVMGTYKDLAVVVLVFCAFQGLVIYYTRFIGLWALEHSTFDYYNTDPEKQFDNWYYISVSWLMLVLIYVLSYIKRIQISTFLLSTNSALHKKMINALTRARVVFFDLNPIGRILNRFANDFGTLDKPNLVSVFDLIDGLLNSLSLLLSVCLVNPILFIPCVIAVYLLYKTKQYFTKPNVLTKKLELSSRSPIFSTVSSTLTGLLIIRVYNSGGRFIREFLDLLYNNSRAFLFMTKTNRIFAIALDGAIRSVMIIGIIGFTVLVFYYQFESALIGLSLLFLMQMGDETSYVIRQTLAVDINMQSAQRMLEYCQLEPEAPENIPKQDSLVESQFQGKWPARGEIIFNNVYLRYRTDLNCALNGLSFKIAAGTKVACVGRTGAGKSSIIQALFRMVEIENIGHENLDDSYIKIDGVDIKTIGLNLLRKRLSIIPQTPVVFTGTIRRNLDPFDEHSDATLWNVLEEVNLKWYVQGLEKQLDTDMTISASVFSAGQKQLICLARAILRKSQVLLLDEATANVDVETDDFIQKKIMEKFADCTVVTIAHRLITIAHYDKVVVMDKGRMVEYGSPYELLVNNVGDDRITKKEGIFNEMVRNTGKSMSKKIFTISKNCYYQKHV